MTRLAFDVVGAAPERFSVVPSLGFRLRIAETTGAAIQAIALRCQINIEPRKRHYTPTEEGLLFELFGEPARWGDTLQTMMWANTSMIVPGFTGSTEVELPMSCTYDFEVAAAKYLHALGDGEVPLVFMFSGSVFTWTPTGISIDQVPWHHEATFGLPVRTWRAAMDRFFPDSGWLRLHRETLDELVRFRGTLATTSWDDTVRALLARAGVASREGAGEPS